jgi:hypothetical protein
MQPEDLHLLGPAILPSFCLAHRTVPFLRHQSVSSIHFPAFPSGAAHRESSRLATISSDTDRMQFCATVAVSRCARLMNRMRTDIASAGTCCKS